MLGKNMGRCIFLVAFSGLVAQASAQGAELHSQFGLATSRPFLRESSQQGTNGVFTVDFERAYGLSTRSILYWTLIGLQRTEYKLGVSIGYTSGSGSVESKGTDSNGVTASLKGDTIYHYAGLGIANGVLVRVNPAMRVFLDLGLDVLPLTATFKVKLPDATISNDYTQTASWHLQLGTTYNLIPPFDLTLATRYEITLLQHSDDDRLRMDVTHFMIGARYAFDAGSESTQRKKANKKANKNAAKAAN